MAPRPAKSGFGSSEFVVTLIAACAAAAVVGVGLYLAKDLYVTLGLGAMGLGQATYTGGRSFAKAHG